TQRCCTGGGDFVFRAPITLSKPGELHEEYRSQLRKLRDEKLQEERTPEDFIHKLIFEDAEVGRRKTEDPKKEEPSGVKMTQEHARNLGSRVERSQSCNDTLRERSKSRQRSAPVRTKVHPPASVSTPVAGVLSSTQNNRCLSAPDLTAEKRAGLGGGAAPLPVAPPKPERSISPESNDSISEELNHFKPIVCSPCTPPKRLPDGRVPSPLIIKSTPRNLTRSLQKPTTYEASPRILRKWEQLSQERQIKRTLSKATLTSSAPDAGEDPPPPSAKAPGAVEEPPRAPNDFLAPGRLTRAHAGSEGSPPLRRAKLESSGSVERDSEAVAGGPAGGAGESLCHPKASNPNSASRLAGSGLGAKTGARKVARVHTARPENGTLGPPTRAAGKRQRRLQYLNGSEWSRLPNGDCRGEEPPSLWRGRKRQCKTKHLEQGFAAKRPRRRGGPAGAEPLRRSQAEQRRQEEEDRRLALQLQWVFDRENRRGARRRGRADQYFLRSQSTAGTP
ncbi:PREDICTED: E3 ubiquitin-protein ligase RNF169, partial [Gekko japonicus]|uniref:RING-type E3 ubiquitin transferase n=1 Tax=Gekko japonicus TaxID=146911 RepID=A0ABM1KJ89_GEKJA